jgi:hypothetical protein
MDSYNRTIKRSNYVGLPYLYFCQRLDLSQLADLIIQKLLDLLHYWAKEGFHLGTVHVVSL